MEKFHDNPVLQYLLVLGISFALILSQTNRLHMHLQHDHHSTVEHIVNVHTTTTLHDVDLADDHGDHHSTIIDISPDNLVKKTNVLNPLVLILLFIGLFLYLPRLTCLPRQRLYKKLFISCYYFLHPPLRAPPLK